MLNPNTIAQCDICRREYTSFHFEAVRGSKLYVCQVCLQSSKSNFIWICLNCGKSYQRPKNLVMNRLNGYGIKFAALLYESKIIQGVDMCLACNPEGIVEYVLKNKRNKLRADLPTCRQIKEI